MRDCSVYPPNGPGYGFLGGGIYFSGGMVYNSGHRKGRRYGEDQWKKNGAYHPCGADAGVYLGQFSDARGDFRGHQRLVRRGAQSYLRRPGGHGTRPWGASKAGSRNGISGAGGGAVPAADSRKAMDGVGVIRRAGGLDGRDHSAVCAGAVRADQGRMDRPGRLCRWGTGLPADSLPLSKKTAKTGEENP